MNSSVFLICGCHALGGREGVWDWRSAGQPNWKINFPGDSSWLLPGCLSQISSILISQIRGRQRGKKILRFEMDCLPLNIFVISSEFSAMQDRGQCIVCFFNIQQAAARAAVFLDLHSTAWAGLGYQTRASHALLRLQHVCVSFLTWPTHPRLASSEIWEGPLATPYRRWHHLLESENSPIGPRQLVLGNG